MGNLCYYWRRWEKVGGNLAYVDCLYQFLTEPALQSYSLNLPFLKYLLNMSEASRFTILIFHIFKCWTYICWLTFSDPVSRLKCWLSSIIWILTGRIRMLNSEFLRLAKEHCFWSSSLKFLLWSFGWKREKWRKISVLCKSFSFLLNLQVGIYNWHVGCLFVYQVEQRVLSLIKSWILFRNNRIIW